MTESKFVCIDEKIISIEDLLSIKMAPGKDADDLSSILFEYKNAGIVEIRFETFEKMWSAFQDLLGVLYIPVINS